MQDSLFRQTFVNNLDLIFNIIINEDSRTKNIVYSKLISILNNLKNTISLIEYINEDENIVHNIYMTDETGIRQLYIEIVDNILRLQTDLTRTVIVNEVLNAISSIKNISFIIRGNPRVNHNVENTFIFEANILPEENELEPVPIPLPEEVKEKINKIEMLEYCVICSEEKDEHRRLLCADTHIICEQCFQRHFESSTKCPFCRADQRTLVDLEGLNIV